MQEFNHGEKVEYYNHAAAEWRKGVYVAKHPNTNRHILVGQIGGAIIDRDDADVRKARVKKEGYINLYRHPFDPARATGGKIFATEAEAKAYNRPEDKITIRIEWFE